MQASYLFRLLAVFCLVTAVLCRPRAAKEEDYVEYVEEEPAESSSPAQSAKSSSEQVVYQGAAPTFQGNAKSSETDTASYEVYSDGEDEDDTHVIDGDTAGVRAPLPLPSQPQPAVAVASPLQPTLAPLPTFAPLPTLATLATFQPWTFPTAAPLGQPLNTPPPPGPDHLKNWIDTVCANLSCGRKK
uniref:Uncharacterized protein n=1 Tax=Plectus sambesii TaxID=2011161 RepID=A0A914X320_9BILA